MFIRFIYEIVYSSVYCLCMYALSAMKCVYYIHTVLHTGAILLAYYCFDKLCDLTRLLLLCVAFFYATKFLLKTYTCFVLGYYLIFDPSKNGFLNPSFITKAFLANFLSSLLIFKVVNYVQCSLFILSMIKDYCYVMYKKLNKKSSQV